MILAELDQLPKSMSNGPESWAEAFGKAVSTTDQVMVSIENINASQENFRASYQSYIDEVKQATGVSIDNPMDIDMRRGTFEARPNPTMSGGTGTEWIEERKRVAMERFEQQRAALMNQYPAQARLIQLDIEGRAVRRMQEADKAAKEAMAAPELGMAGRFTAGLIGGLTGSAKDPYQWATAMIGGGAGAARTVAGRLGQVMLTEALVNGGTEAVLQAASQERKKQAGLEHGLDNALKNVGIAATFGALFGGTVQGGAELARIYKLGEGGADLAARVIDGRPEPGDVETLARAMNIELTPDRLDMLNRSFEERVLDEVTIPPNASPAQMKVYEAALRYAEDPDNNLSPDLVERIYAEEEAGRLSTLTADQYERAYGGDEAAIADIADTFFAEDLDQAARSGSDWDRNARPDLPPVEPGYVRFYHGGAGDLGDVSQLEDLWVSPDYVYARDYRRGDQPNNVWYVDIPEADTVRVGVKDEVNNYYMSGKVPAEYARKATRVEVPTRAVPARPMAASDPVEGQRIRPEREAEPYDDTAMRYAEEQAGEIRDPEVDANGNYRSLYELLPIEDGDGNVTLMSPRQALAIADEDNFHADLLEACKL